ncbi:MAG: hypothetical protein KKF00_03980 [Proteobacteria bacterium]|nr:hypothetical protein [Pseudomonadota bacterium]
MMKICFSTVDVLHYSVCVSSSSKYFILYALNTPHPNSSSCRIVIKSQIGIQFGELTDSRLPGSRSAGRCVGMLDAVALTVRDGRGFKKG